VKFFGECSDFIALQKFLRHDFTKVQVPWVKILTLKMSFGVLFNFCQKDQKLSVLFTFYFLQNKAPFSGLFFTKIWSNAEEHIPSQYFNSRDLTFKNLASKFSKWLKISNLMYRGAFFQFSFRWIYYHDSNKSTGKETGKTHLCAVWWFEISQAQ